jgi:hypothetical protein
MKTQWSIFAITDTAEIMGDATFHSDPVQRAYFRLSRSHYAIAKLLQDCTTQKRTHHPQESQKTLQYTSREDISETT